MTLPFEIFDYFFSNVSFVASAVNKKQDMKFLCFRFCCCSNLKKEEIAWPLVATKIKPKEISYFVLGSG